MPELPEVETIRRDLSRMILAKGVREVIFHSDRCVFSDKDGFSQTLTANRFENIRRHGKMLIFDLAYGEYTLLVHLKMTGKLICEAPGGLIAGDHPDAKIDTLPNQYTHVEIRFADESRLFFHDIRALGWMRLVDEDTFQQVDAKLGADPLMPDFTPEAFLKLLDNRKGEVKAFLLSQSLIAGIGNIYADEILYRARIRPGRKISDVDKAGRNRLYNAIRAVLDSAVSKRGTTFSNFVDVNGQKGGYLPYLKVYNRNGERCYRCGDDYIQKTVTAGRGTYYCESCQK